MLIPRLQHPMLSPRLMLQHIPMRSMYVWNHLLQHHLTCFMTKKNISTHAVLALGKYRKNNVIGGYVCV